MPSVRVAGSPRNTQIHMGTKQTSEFRQEVVRVALTSGLSRKQVASDFGIGFSTLSRWVKEERNTITASEPRTDLIQENERLRKENRLLREEREILKKATVHSIDHRNISANLSAGVLNPSVFLGRVFNPN